MEKMYENAKMAGMALQGYGQMQGQLNARNSAGGQVYGGDCALDPDGLSSSTKRLKQVVNDLNQATFALREFFGMNAAGNAAGDAPRPSGHKSDIDALVVSARESLVNVQLLLSHLNS